MENAANPRPAGSDEVEGKLPAIVEEEEALLRVVLAKLDQTPRRARLPVDDAGRLIELRDALAEAKPEDHGSLLEQMHRVSALARQRGKGESSPVDRSSPYFGHLRLEENGRRRDVLIGQRGFVEPGGGVQIVDWRHAPVSRLYYRYDEGDSYEEQIGDRMVEGAVIARRAVSIVDGQLRRVTSPQGTWVREGAAGSWRRVEVREVRLRVGSDGTVAFPAGEPTPVAPPTPAAGTTRQPGRRLGLDEGEHRRRDRHLPAIAALIDPRQFELITRPTSGLVALQGSAGSGKTTIGLHRIAYLAFAQPRRFRPDRMLVVVYQRALARYVSRVLPALDVHGVPVLTFSAWAHATRRATFPMLHAPLAETTPTAVMRLKSHSAMLRILADRNEEMAAWCRRRLELAAQAHPAAAPVLGVWDRNAGPMDERVTSLARWLRSASLDASTRAALENTGRELRGRVRDVVGEWANLLTDRAALERGLARYAPGLLSEGELDLVHRWCTDRERLRTAEPGEEDEVHALDLEDEALLLRMHQLQLGPVAGPRGPLVYEHLMVDEVQDFSPVELAVLLETSTPQRSVTLAGDTAQAIAPEHGFSDWSDLLEELGIPHDRVEPLRVSYRSTRQIVDCAEHVLGPLAGDVRPVAPRSGQPVEALGFGSVGEGAELLSQALKDLVRTDADLSVALIARHPEQARLYHEALAQAEVPFLRLVADQDFPFTPGIDVTDVRQTKGLEFDIVILLEASAASYPVSDDARRLLHVAMTRAAHQLWITWTGEPTSLLPGNLREPR